MISTVLMFLLVMACLAAIVHVTKTTQFFFPFGLAAPDSYRADIPREVNNFYDRVLLTRAIPRFLHGLFGQKRSIPLGGGTNVIKFRRYSNLTAATTALTEGVTPIGASMATTEITATALQYGNWTRWSDLVQLETPDAILTEFTEILGDNEGDTIDILGRNILVAGTTVQYASSAASRVTVTSSMKMVAAEILEAVRTLSVANAMRITEIAGGSPNIGTIPINASFVGIVHPRTTYDLKGLTGWSAIESYAQNVGQVLPGEVGKLDVVRFVESTNTRVFTGEGDSGIDVYATLILGANAYGDIDLGNSQNGGAIIKALGTGGTTDPLNQRGTIGWKAHYIAKILNEAFMVRIEHAVT